MVFKTIKRARKKFLDTVQGLGNKVYNGLGDTLVTPIELPATTLPITIVLAAGALCAAGCSADKGWTKFHALYDCKDRHAIYKVEGTAKSEKTGTDFWGFGQAKAAREHTGDTEGYFVKLRADQKLGLDKYGLGGLCATAEHSAGTGFTDVTKAGLVYKTKLGDTFVMFKALPVRTDGKEDTTLGVLVSRDLIKGKENKEKEKREPARLKITGWLDRDIRAETYVGEITLDARIYDNLELSIGAISSGSIHEAKKVNPYVGLKLGF